MTHPTQVLYAPSEVRAIASAVLADPLATEAERARATDLEVLLNLYAAQDRYSGRAASAMQSRSRPNALDTAGDARIRQSLDAAIPYLEERCGVTSHIAQESSYMPFIDHQSETALGRAASEVREARAAAVRRELQAGQTFDTRSTDHVAPARITREAATYRKGGSESYLKDLFLARTEGNREALDRLTRNDRENRALSNTGQTSVIGAGGGAGGELAPPAWMVAEYVALARPGRPVADLVQQLELPAGISSVNLPRVATGTTTAIQATQNTAVSQTDLTTNSVSSSISTIAGKQVVSRQLIDQGVNVDEVVFGDLMADYAKQLDAQVLSGTGLNGQLRGLLGVSGLTSITYTDASPSVAGAGKLYAQVAKMIATTNATRFAPLTCLVMRPERWGWLQAAFDTSNRPIFLPSGDQGPQNSAGILTRVASEAVVGHMHGLPVIVDAQIPTTGSQDVIIGLRASDLWLWSSPIQAEAFTATYADTMGVLFRLFAYHAFIPDRQPKSIATISGTGLAYPPTY